MDVRAPAVTGPRGPATATVVGLVVVLTLPMLGLAVLLAAPSTDGHWEHQPSHFWLVLGAAALSALLGWAIGTASRRRRDARLFVVSLAFVTSAAFLALHALATPQVLLDGSNAGFVVAVPVGLVLAGGFAAWSAVDLDGARARAVMVRAGLLRYGLLVVVGLWGAWSLASVWPLDEPNPPESGSWFMVALAVPGVALFLYSAFRYFSLARRRRSALLVAIGCAWVLLGEAMFAVAFARNWRASWWEWHALMLVAFATIAWAVRRLPESERFSELYLDDVAAGAREVSVLFADLQGFTSYSEANPPSAVQAMLNEYFEAVLPSIRAIGGRVDRFIGDAIMVTFNVSSEQPDHAERAARAGLALQASAAPVAARHPDWPRFRVGINTGPAQVGVIGGADDRGYTVLGDTVNVASRIEGLAPAGGVAIGGATLRAVAGAQVSHLGSMPVKGRTEPVDVWQLDALPGEQ